MKKYFVAFLMMMAIPCLQAQNCLPEGIMFTTQEQVDNFQANFPGCTQIEGDVTIMETNGFITSLIGLSPLTSIGGNLSIINNSFMTGLAGLHHLTSIGGHLAITYNGSLASLTGLNALTSVGGNLEITGNDALTSLQGLHNLNSINGALDISENGSLTNLTGLDNINAGSIVALTIFSNLSLSSCAVQSICDYLVFAGDTAFIQDNVAGCNSQEEVEAACEVGLEESAVGSWQLAVNIYPNPFSTQITLMMPNIPNNNTILTIYAINGQRIVTHIITEKETVLDVSGLTQGIYFMRVTDHNTVQVGKFVKQ